MENNFNILEIPELCTYEKEQLPRQVRGENSSAATSQCIAQNGKWPLADI